MAVSVSASATVPSLSRRSSTQLSPYYCSSKLSFSSSLRFQPIRIVNRSVSARYRPLQVNASELSLFYYYCYYYYLIIISSFSCLLNFIT